MSSKAFDYIGVAVWCFSVSVIDSHPFLGITSTGISAVLLKRAWIARLVK